MRRRRKGGKPDYSFQACMSNIVTDAYSCCSDTWLVNPDILTLLVYIAWHVQLSLYQSYWSGWLLAWRRGLIMLMNLAQMDPKRRKRKLLTVVLYIHRTEMLSFWRKLGTAFLQLNWWNVSSFYGNSFILLLFKLSLKQKLTKTVPFPYYETQLLWIAPSGLYSSPGNDGHKARSDHYSQAILEKVGSQHTHIHTHTHTAMASKNNQGI